MSSSARVVRWLLAAAVLLFGIPARGADPYRYLPENSEFILSVNVNQLLDAPLVKRHAPVVARQYFLSATKALLDGNEAGKQFLARNEEAIQGTVKDPAEVRKRLDAFRTELRTVVVAGKLEGGDEDVLFLFECSLDAEQFAELVEGIKSFTGKEVQTTRISGKDLHEISMPGTEGSLSFALLEKGVVLVTPNVAYAKEAIATAAGKHKRALNKDLQDLLDGVDRKQGAWMVAVEKEEDVRITAGISVGENVRFRAVVTARDAEAARKQAAALDEGLKSLTSYVDAATALHKPLAALGERLRALRPEVKGNQVIVEFGLEDKVIGAMLQKPRD